MNDSIGNVVTHESNMQESQCLVDPFLSNPFRLLRLPASAKNEEINARYQEARIQAQLASESTRQGILDELLQAQGELLDRRKRMPHEASWFYDPAQPLFDEIVPELTPVLEGYRGKALGSDRPATLAKHDYANWLLLHACHADDSETQKTLCLRALASWSELLSDGNYLELLNASFVSGRVDDRDIWQRVVFDPLAKAGRRQTSKENRAGAIPYAEAAKTFGADSEQILLVAGPTLASLQDNGRGLLKQIQEERGKTSLTMEAAQDWSEKVETAFTPLHELAGFLDEGDCIESRAILDEAAELLRGVALDLIEKKKAYPEALDLFYRATELAGSEDLQTKLEGELRQARENTFKLA